MVRKGRGRGCSTVGPAFFGQFFVRFRKRVPRRSPPKSEYYICRARSQDVLLSVIGYRCLSKTFDDPYFNRTVRYRFPAGDVRVNAFLSRSTVDIRPKKRTPPRLHGRRQSLVYCTRKQTSTCIRKRTGPSRAATYMNTRFGKAIRAIRQSVSANGRRVN